MSSHRVDVVRLGPIEDHPNADRLGVVTVFGWRCVVAKGEFSPGQLVAYVPPDSLVDTRRSEFAFLRRDGRDCERIKVKRLRGVYSQGLLIRAPEGAIEGADVAEVLGVRHYEPPAPACDAEVAPPGVFPVYDVENLRRFPDVIGENDQVAVTEKIHGASARFFWNGERFYVGSHRQWKKDGDNVYWRALRQVERTVGFMLKAAPWVVAYGEVYGAVQKLRYGLAPGVVDLRLFDLWHLRENRWLSWEESASLADQFHLPWVPVLRTGTAGDLDGLLSLGEGPSAIAAHVREGAVVRLVTERFDGRLPNGRVLLKIVGNGYLEQS